MTLEHRCNLLIDLGGFQDIPVGVYANHIRRYEFVANFLCGGDSVLDICCGSGYGVLIMMRTQGVQVMGIDKDEKAIEWGLQKYYPAVRLVCKDILEHQFTLFDVITMFEALEHFKKEDGKELLRRAGESCRRIMFVSFPDDSHFDNNEYHLAQWSPEELRAEMSKYFRSVGIFGQSWVSGQVYFPYEERKSLTIVMGIK